MVKGTLLGREPSTFSSQRAHCLSAFRLAPLSSRYASICHSSLRPCPHSFNFQSFPFLFILSAPFHPFISLVHVPLPTCFYLPPSSGISTSVWCFLLCPHSLCHWSIIGFPWHSTDLSFITSISSPPVLLSLCSLKSGDVPSLSWMFSNSSSHSATNPFIHASTTVTCLNSQCGPASLKHGKGLMRAPTLAKYLHDFVFLQCLGKPVAPLHIWFQVAACVLCCVGLLFSKEIRVHLKCALQTIAPEPHSIWSVHHEKAAPVKRVFFHWCQKHLLLSLMGRGEPC